ncbi:MAG: hypothetical protein FJX62_25295, partial [Alphaproteobacteria bacterium]|nr:hypothetical protein [Alphaproteobacteria bacterium]
MKSIFTAAAALALLGGCGTVFDGTRQAVEIEVTDGRVPLAGANCTVTTPTQGEMTVTAPARIVVPRHSVDLHVSCSHPGYVPAHGRLLADFNGTAENTPY